MTRKTLEEMTNKELNNLHYVLAMKYDDEMRSVFDGTNEMYDENDLDSWDSTIHKIGEILRARPIENPKVTYTYGAATDEDHPWADYWRCEVKDDCWIRFSYVFFNSEQEARQAFAVWCSENGVLAYNVPERIVYLSKPEKKAD